jgi:hypothetical protein
VSTTTATKGNAHSKRDPFTGELLPKGIDWHNGRYRVRLTFPGVGTHAEYHGDLETATLRVALMRERRRAGLLPTASKATTLGDGARAVLAEATAPKRGLTPGGVQWWERITKPWRDGPHSTTPGHLLNVAKLRAELRARIAQHPKAGKDELAALQRILRTLRADDSRVPELILDAPARRPRREREALAVSDLDLWASCAPTRSYQLLHLLQGSIGNRIGELLQSRPEHWDLARGYLYVPQPKEQRPKRIVLLPDEVELAREQLQTVAPGADTVWTMPNGEPFPYRHGRVQHSYFDRHVWQPTKAAAIAAWRAAEHASPFDATPYDQLTSHDLRATAITTMRDLGVSEETCAWRVGHADGGGLVRRIYDRGSREDRAERELRKLGGAGFLTTARGAVEAPAPSRDRPGAGATIAGEGGAAAETTQPPHWKRASGDPRLPSW